MSVRLAQETDIESIIGFDHAAQADKAQRNHIERAIEAESAWVFLAEEQVVGVVIVEYTFFACGFVALLHTHPDYRRQGVGTALLRYVETTCKTQKLFTSTNESNRPMHVLLAACGYAPSGVVNNLDEGDPEIIYFKATSRSDDTSTTRH